MSLTVTCVYCVILYFIYIWFWSCLKGLILFSDNILLYAHVQCVYDKRGACVCLQLCDTFLLLPTLVMLVFSSPDPKGNVGIVIALRLSVNFSHFNLLETTEPNGSVPLMVLTKWVLLFVPFSQWPSWFLIG